MNIKVLFTLFFIGLRSAVIAASVARPPKGGRDSLRVQARQVCTPGCCKVPSKIYEFSGSRKIFSKRRKKRRLLNLLLDQEPREVRSSEPAIPQGEDAGEEER